MNDPRYDLLWQGLSFSYGSERTIDYPDLQIEKGSHWLIIGPSGSGKTTLLNIVSGLLKPDQGKVIIRGEDLYALPPNKIDGFRGKHVGMVFQVPRFFSALSVEENLLMANYLAGRAQEKDRVKYLLDSLGLSGAQNKKITSFSIGEKQRLSLARALMNSPEILIADEPSASLDDQHCDELIALIEKEAEEFGSTLLVVSHDARLKSKFSNQMALS